MCVCARSRARAARVRVVQRCAPQAYRARQLGLPASRSIGYHHYPQGEPAVAVARPADGELSGAAQLFFPYPLFKQPVRVEAEGVYVLLASVHETKHVRMCARVRLRQTRGGAADGGADRGGRGLEPQADRSGIQEGALPLPQAAGRCRPPPAASASPFSPQAVRASRSASWQRPPRSWWRTRRAKPRRRAGSTPRSTRSSPASAPTSRCVALRARAAVHGTVPVRNIGASM